MAYIGNSYEIQRTTPSIDYFNGNGVTTTFTLSKPVISNTGMIVVVNNVPQNPASAFALNASNQIVFTEAPSAGTNNIYVQYNAVYGQVGTIGQGTVGTSALGSISNINSIGSNLTLETNGVDAVTIDQNQNVIVSGSIGQLGNSYAEKTVSLGYFPNGITNQVVYLNFGNNNINGYMEVEVNATFSYQSSVGILRKVFSFGFNQNNSQWYPATSRISEANGTIINNIVIGEMEWDTATSQYRLPIYHIVSTGNQYYARVKSFGGSPGAQILQYMTVSGFSTRAAPTTLNNVSFNGYVTYPGQPIISLDGNFGARSYTAPYTILDLSPVVSQGGMTWSSTTGRVTVPIAGVYEIHLQVYHYNIGGVRSTIQINGALRSLAHSSNASTADETRGQTIIRTLGAGDYITFVMTGGTQIYTGGAHTTAYVRLIA